ncbi:MAG: rod shape-determining protein MreC [Candidatus Marinimicrobia bacterium]|nr:rod shape-determining protein MreC [Candidatus Neomarinimicrobiota bacterium]
MWRKILSILFDFYDYFLLILLIFISFLILFMNEAPEVRSFQGDVADVFAFIHYPGIWLEELSGLLKENEALTQENLQLKLQNIEFKEAYLENRRLKKMLGFLDSTAYVIVPAKVINRGTAPIANSILLNVGRNEGVVPNLAVISTKGIIGKTIAVGDKTTQCQIFQDVNFRLSVKFQNSRVYGIVMWQPDGSAIVREIPNTAEIHPGELVLTSGYSKIYPPNIIIGEVIEVHRAENEPFQSVIIRSNADINTIEEAFVILSY